MELFSIRIQRTFQLVSTEEAIQIIKQYGTIDVNTILLIVYKLIEISPKILDYFSLK